MKASGLPVFSATRSMADKLVAKATGRPSGTTIPNDARQSDPEFGWNMESESDSSQQALEKMHTQDLFITQDTSRQMTLRTAIHDEKSHMYASFRSLSNPITSSMELTPHLSEFETQTPEMLSQHSTTRPKLTSKLSIL